VDTLNDILMFMCFAQTGALSVSGAAAFSATRTGRCSRGHRHRRLKRAGGRGAGRDPIYGVIRGLGSSSDGRAKSIYAPLAKGQALALDRAYGNAGYSPSTVELVEAHGTGTQAATRADSEALVEVSAGRALVPCASTSSTVEGEYPRSRMRERAQRLSLASGA